MKVQKFVVKKVSTLLPLLAWCFSVVFSAFTPLTQAAEYIKFQENRLNHAKQTLKSGQALPITQKAFKDLIKKADQRLLLMNPTVVNKRYLPPSKNKHDYLSISRYWWPDPKSRTGLPWIRHDGVTNPSTQTDDVDRNRLGKMAHSVKVLALAYYFTEDEKYASKGISIINTWFLDERTKMNPHLKYGQSVPGNPKGRRSGILDGRLIPEHVIDAITMFSASPSWTKPMHEKMQTWLNEYFIWLTTSKLGKAGAKQKNNHGSWYRFQVATLAWYLGKHQQLADIVEVTKAGFAEQFDVNGAQAHELKRTRGFFYSCFNLNALVYVANIAEKPAHMSAGSSVGKLWPHTLSTGQSFQRAIDYLLPVAKGEEWPHASKNIEVSYIAPILANSIGQIEKDEYKVVLIGLLNKLASQKTLTSVQQRTLHEFALFYPEYFIEKDFKP